MKYYLPTRAKTMTIMSRVSLKQMEANFSVCHVARQFHYRLHYSVCERMPLRVFQYDVVSEPNNVPVVSTQRIEKFHLPFAQMVCSRMNNLRYVLTRMQTNEVTSWPVYYVHSFTVEVHRPHVIFHQSATDVISSSMAVAPTIEHGELHSTVQSIEQLALSKPIVTLPLNQSCFV